MLSENSTITFESTIVANNTDSTGLNDINRIGSGTVGASNSLFQEDIAATSVLMRPEPKYRHGHRVPSVRLVFGLSVARYAAQRFDAPIARCYGLDAEVDAIRVGLEVREREMARAVGL